MPDDNVPTLEEAVAFSLDVVRGLARYLDSLEPSQRRRDDHGYDLHASTLAYMWGDQRVRGTDGRERDRIALNASPVLYEAAWVICQRGILRPGTINLHEHGQPGGNGYTITSFGRHWLATTPIDDHIVLQPGTLADTLRGFAGRFGEGYNQRTQEAVLCRSVHASLACCAMVGAATEAILLALAVEKTKDEDKVFKSYHAGGGRLNVTKMVTQGLKDHAKDTLVNFLGLLVYWRDDAAHGGVTEVTQANADEALRQLLHFSQWAHKNWNMLTS